MREKLREMFGDYDSEICTYPKQKRVKRDLLKKAQAKKEKICIFLSFFIESHEERENDEKVDKNVCDEEMVVKNW